MTNDCGSCTHRKGTEKFHYNKLFKIYMKTVLTRKLIVYRGICNINIIFKHVIKLYGELTLRLRRILRWNK